MIKKPKEKRKNKRGWVSAFIAIPFCPCLTLWLHLIDAKLGLEGFTRLMLETDGDAWNQVHLSTLYHVSKQCDVKGEMHATMCEWKYLWIPARMCLSAVLVSLLNLILTSFYSFLPFLLFVFSLSFPSLSHIV